MDVEGWAETTGTWVEGITAGLLISIVPLFAMGWAGGIGIKVLRKPIEVIGGV